MMNGFRWMSRRGTAFARRWWRSWPLPAVACAVVLAGSEAAGYGQTPKPAGASVELVGDPVISAGSEVTVTFAEAMVSATEIDVQAQKSPITFVPEVKGTFLWKSQTEGQFTAAAVPPGATIKVMLAPDLVDLAGKPVKPAKPGEPLGVRRSHEFTIEAYSPKNPIQRRPSVELTFNERVKPTDLADTAWFQDRDSRKRYPAEVFLQAGEQEKESRSATVAPREDLPVGRTFDLVVEGLKDADTGTVMKQPFVKQLGETEALKVVKIAAFNYPLRSPRITVQFSEPVHPRHGAEIKIEPPVKVKTVAQGDELWLEGAFDIHQRYRVTVPAEITGKRGFPMAGPSTWNATFHGKKPSLIFPTEDLHQRSRLGLRFAFLQVNTGALQWRLARVPPEKLLAVSKRLREFTEVRNDPVTGEQMLDAGTGWPVWQSSESLIEASRLEPVAQGQFEASAPEADTRREIAWKPDRGLVTGTFVLEVTGRLADGRALANRAMITFTELAVTQKRVDGTCLVRVTRISDGQPAPGLHIRSLGPENDLLAQAVTDRNGIAAFDPRAKIGRQPSKPSALWLYVETPEGPILQTAQPTRFNESGYEGLPGELAASRYRLMITSDRPIYRPGELLKMKGFVREVEAAGSLRVPHAREVTWQIENDGDRIATGKAKVDEYGGFEAEWKLPASLSVGEMQLSATFEGIRESQDFVVQEFRPPPFLVSLTDLKPPGDESGVRISSAYFHGAPNAGAHVRWQALWTAHHSYEASVMVTDVPRQVAVQPELTQSVKGEGVLNADGTLELRMKSPFKDGVVRGWYDVEWSVEVTAVDGQTIAERGQFPVFAVPVELVIEAGQKAPGEEEANPLTISIQGSARGREPQAVPPVPLSVEIYHAITKTVKEQISPNVYRYRNSVTYEKDQTIAGATPLKREVRVPGPGDYLVVIRDTADAKVPPAFSQVYVAGPGETEFPVKDEQSLGVACDRKMDNDDPQSGYLPGEKAMISVQAPFSGLAWVSVEAEKIVDTLFVALDGNSSRFELPIKKEYGPNAWVSVYLLHPGGEDRLPAERYGAVRIKVRRPDLVLQVAPQLAAKEVQPKDTISGQIAVTCEGRPVKGADLTVYAVDEAVLDAGLWHEPHLSEMMYPERPWRVGTYQGLPNLSSGVDESSLHQKGFIVGARAQMKGVASSVGATDLRTNFPPLAFWKTHLSTDREGKAPFSFPAPDSLTKYRIVVLAQTKEGQFGTGSDWVELSKPVQVEPALPRFVRVGDDVELRVIVRQKVADELAVNVRCTTSLALINGPSQEQKVRRGVPVVYRFPAKVGEMESATVRFETEAGTKDAVAISLPVLPPTLLRKEALFGSLEEVRQRIPEGWDKATGKVDAILSNSPWLPKLTGLPLLLEYPHGCFEQITSRVLAYTALTDLLAYLPLPAERETAYRLRVENGLAQIQSAVSEAGYLPYWAGGKASAYPTVAGYWAMQSAVAQKFAVPNHVLNDLGEATVAIARGESREVETDPFCRAFALMALAQRPDAARELMPVAREMYLRREGFEPDVRALLAIALHGFGGMAAEQQQLLREIDAPSKERAFDPDHFGSTTRSEAIRALAFAVVDPQGSSGKPREQLRARIDEFLDSSESLSTQENFWLLLAFRAMHPAAGKVAPAFPQAEPHPTAISPNKASALWANLEIRRIHDFAPRVRDSGALTSLMSAQYRSDSPVTARVGNGFRIERVVRNLTAAARSGTAKAPFRLGDQILITYRLTSPKLHHFVVLEDELPAGLETVNPDIASIARTYSVPQEKGTRQLPLSHSELRDHVTCLYFNRVDAGIATYSVLARATCAGVFRWPATQVVPMYDSRFSGLSPSEICHVSAE